jgi:hypothetical protein
VPSYKGSIHALEDLLLSAPDTASSSSSCSCRITWLSKDITVLRNGAEYCLIEVTCDDGIQYGIQAYGDEAVELHKEALKYYDALQEQEEEENEKESITFAIYNLYQ